MTLFFYVARRFMAAFLRVLIIITAIVLLLETVENVRRFSDQPDSLSKIVFMTALKLPSAIDQIMPLVILISSLTLFLGLARSSELVICRASSVSGIRLVLVPVLIAMVMGFLSIALLNPLTAATIKRYTELRAEMSDSRQSILSISDEGLWLRQVVDGKNTVIQARRASPDGTVLHGAEFHVFDDKNILHERVIATRATLNDAEWVLSDARRWSINRDAALPTRTERLKSAKIATNLTSDQILDSFAPPQTISFWDMPKFIAQLEISGFTATRHKQFYHSTLALPALFAAMVLIGAGFTMRHVRFGNVGIMVIFAVLTGFALYFMRNIAGSLGSAGEVPILIAAWAPPIASMLLVIGLLLHLEDG